MEEYFFTQSSARSRGQAFLKDFTPKNFTVESMFVHCNKSDPPPMEIKYSFLMSNTKVVHALIILQ